ncbi:MAG: hypothetical protein AAF914_14435 [Pseudomonadota bacterium]
MADIVGVLAAGLVLATFCTSNFTALRALALASNVAFISYGVVLELWPVVGLHAALLPVNIWHLVKLTHAKRQDAQTAPALPPASRRPRAVRPSPYRPVRL